MPSCSFSVPLPSLAARPQTVPSLCFGLSPRGFDRGCAGAQNVAAHALFEGGCAGTAGTAELCACIEERCVR